MKAPQRKRLKARQGFTLVEILVVVIIIGLLAAISQSNFMAAQDKARCANVQSNLKLMAVGLESFSSDNNGRYPMTADIYKDNSDPIARGLLSNRYLPGDKWPSSPWNDKVRQDATSTVTPTAPMETAANYVLTPHSLHHVMARATDLIDPPALGNRPSTPTYTNHTYGAIVYDYVPEDTVWVLFGIGKDHNNPILAGARSNGGS